MSKIVGIDLGTTNSLVATVEAGIPFVIADEDGRRLTPSVVHFPADGAQPVVGTKARRARVLQPERTVYSIKRFMGRRASEIEAEERNVAYLLSGEGAGPLQVALPGRRVTPEEISAEILKKLKASAEHGLSEEVTRAVITVPAYFNDAQRNATKRAGELAGLTVERILNEPTAAALAYGLDRLHERAKIAVFDLGGGTFDLSILELHDGVFQVLATNGNTRLGGDDLDRRLVEFLGESIRKEGGPDLASDPVARARVMEGAEEAKIKLSFETAVDLSFPFLTPDFSFHHRLERAAFEDLTRDLIDRTRPHCLRALADAKLAPTDLDQVILVGGQTRMPLVRDFVGKLFQCVEFEATAGQIRLGQNYHRPAGPMLNLTQNPDEAVALGAAIQAEILSGGFKNLLLLDVTPLSLGLETFGGLMNVLIPRNSTIPIKAGEVFTTAVDHQKEMLIHVLQGEREKARDNWTLGRFSIEFETAPKGVPRVGVQFQIDADGILQVLARDIKTGRQRIVEMKSAVDVADADVQRMVEESVEHAFEDLAARRWVETKLRATETIQATRKGMAEYAEDLPAETVQTIHAALKNLEELCELGDEIVTNEMVTRLKAGHLRLDEVTAPLAELMMDHAMEAMLKQRGLIY